MRPHRPRGAVVLVTCALAAAALALLPMAGSGSWWSNPDQSDLRRLETAGLGHSRADHEGTPADVVRDLRRARRCARDAYRVGHPGACPATRADRHRAPAGRLRTENAGPPGVDGVWSAPFAIPALGIHSVLLPTGKVLIFAYPEKGANSSTAWLWDPDTAGYRRADPPPGPNGEPINIWCAGQTLLPDGRVVVAGGNLEYPPAGSEVGYKGLNRILTFNPWNERWTEQPQMRHGRWYPTLTTLSDGRVVIVGGWDESGEETTNTDVEVFTPSAALDGVGTLERKPTAARNTLLYPHMWLIPGGDVLMAGPGREDTAILDTQDWTWRDLPNLPDNREWGSAVLLPAGVDGPTRVMLLGGANRPTTRSATATTAVLDLNAPQAGWAPGPTMIHPRGHLNTVVLPDGALLSVGGGIGQGGDPPSPYTDPVYQSEILEPGAGAWRGVTSQAEERTYHSTALLLPDGKVFAAGDDRPDHTQDDMGETYRPAYLEKDARRPTIDSAPGVARYGQALRVTTRDPWSVDRAVLVHPGATTHANDMAQRSIQLRMSADDDGLTLTTPAEATLAPPGYWMLFLISDEGVPSFASWLRLDPAATDPPGPPPPPPPPSGPPTPAPADAGPGVTAPRPAEPPAGVRAQAALAPIPPPAAARPAGAPRVTLRVERIVRGRARTVVRVAIRSDRGAVTTVRLLPRGTSRTLRLRAGRRVSLALSAPRGVGPLRVVTVAGPAGSSVIRSLRVSATPR